MKRGKPFPPLNSHKLTCGWCGHSQEEQSVVKFMGIRIKSSYACDNCSRRLTINKSRLGFFSAYKADNARYLRNVAKGVNRI